MAPACADRPRRAFSACFAACAVGLTLSCGVSDRPAALGDSFPLDASNVRPGPGSFDLGGTPAVPTCNLGPEGGVCACADESLDGDVPNIYFVLDRSGSMNELGKWDSVRLALESLFVALGPRATMGAAAFPDPHFDDCSAGVEVLAPRRGDAPAGTLGPVEAAMVTTLSSIPAAGGTPTAATLTAILPKLLALPGKTYVILATDGGPNCNAGATCDVSRCTDNIENAMGCPPAGPTNCCSDPANGGALACLDDLPSIAAASAIAAAGIPLYVVGVPGSAPYAALLDKLAAAGGTARGTEPQYYAIDSADQTALAGVLSSIAAKITGTCTLHLDHVPAATGLVNVFFDERALPQAGPDGWTIEGADVTISGASCQKILDGAVLDVRVVVGCPTVTL